MKRFIEESLLEWKKSDRRKPLIVRGARQVGKTYSIKKFGKSIFSRLITVDLEKERNFHSIFEADLNPTRIISELEVFLNKKITPTESLLFIDEIQSCPRAIMALRYFYEEIPELHVIAAGSLMEFSMQDISFPVGRIQFLDMNPLTFPEYLIAVGKEEAANIVLSKPKALSDPIHRLLLDELKKYCFIGGMPESIKVYADSKSLKESFLVHRELNESFRHDFSKYTPRIGIDCLDSVLTGIARHVGQQIIYTHLTDICTHPTVKKAFHTLCKARLISKVSSTSPAGMPLKASASSKRFKAIMVDIGLWQHLNGTDVAKEYPKSDLLSIYQGAMAEQYVGQEILAAQNSSLYYWSRSAKGSTAEVDYLAVIDEKIVPIEVKSGPAGRLRSLHLLLNTFQNCPFGIIFSSAHFSELKDQRLKFIPLYYAYSMMKKD